MSTLREAAQQALEAMSYSGLDVGKFNRINAACAALRAALAEPAQEPVAWYFEARHIDSAWGPSVFLKHPGPEGSYLRKVTPLYAVPPQRQPEQAQPVAEPVQEPRHISYVCPQCHWSLNKQEPLTEDEVAQMWSPHSGGAVRRPILGWAKVIDFARAIEAAHGIGSKT